MRKMQNRNGFTLVELIVVLIIIGILLALVIPNLTGWIDRAKEKHLIAGCRSCVMAAQTLVTEEYGKSGNTTAPTPAKVTELADVDGMASNILVGANAGSVDMLTYTENSDSVTYERLPEPHYTYGADVSGYATQAAGFTAFVQQWMQDKNKTTLKSDDKSNLYKAYYSEHSVVPMPEEYKQKMIDAGLMPKLKGTPLYWWSYPVTDSKGNLLYTVTFANEYGDYNGWTGDGSRQSIQKGYVVVVDGETYVRTSTSTNYDVAPGSQANAYQTEEDLIKRMLQLDYKLVN